MFTQLLMAACLHHSGVVGGEWAPRENEERDVKIAMTAWMVVALLLLGLSISRASDKDETVVTVQVNSADHEVQRGRKVKIVLTEAASWQLSKIER